FQESIKTFLQSSTVAAFGMLMVLEMAPEMKGCAAASMRIWLSTERQRLPIRPQGLAQSKTARCSSFRCGAPSKVMAPQQKVLAASISALVKPKAPSMSKLASLSCSDEKPKAALQNSSPKVHLLKTKRMSKPDCS